MKVLLSAQGNPDMDEPKNIGIKSQWVAVSSLKEASARVQEFLEEHDLGSGNWTGGDVVDASGKKIARISFNGRAWMPGPYPQPEIALENGRLVSAARQRQIDRLAAPIKPLGEAVKGDHVQFTYRGELVHGVVVRVKKDGTRTVDVSGSHSDEDLSWVDVGPPATRNPPRNKAYILSDADHIDSLLKQAQWKRDDAREERMASEEFEEKDRGAWQGYVTDKQRKHLEAAATLEAEAEALEEHAYAIGRWAVTKHKAHRNPGSQFRVSVVAPPDPLGVERSVAIQPCKSNKDCVAAAKYYQSEARNLVPGTQIHIQNKDTDGVWRTLVQYDYLVLQSEWRRTYR